MKNLVKKAFAISGIFAIMFGFSSFFSPMQVNASGGDTGGSLICNIFPFLKSVGFGINEGICGGNAQTAVSSVGGLARLAVNLIFIGIIIISIFIIINAAIKYIRSEGNDEKIQEAQKSIKSVFIGIAALFIGIIGLIIVLAFFSATDAVNNPLNDDSVVPPEFQNL